MTPEPNRVLDRDDALRALLVRQVEESGPRLRAPQLLTVPQPRPAEPSRRRTLLVTVVVAIAVVLASAAALTVRPPVSGGTATGSASAVATPTGSPTPGQVLAVLTSDDGPKQTRTIHPEGLALRITTSCTGSGTFAISVHGDSEESGSCGGEGSSEGNKGMAGSTTVRVTASDKRAVWRVTITAIAETYVTPTPVATATAADGAAIPFCTSSDLAARFSPLRLSSEVTEAEGGQLVLTNTSASRCALAGYPRLQFLDRAGQLLGRHSNGGSDQRSSTAKGIRPVIVAPGHRAYVQLNYYNRRYFQQNRDSTCAFTDSTAMRVDLANSFAGPGQHGVLVVRTPVIHACENSTLQLFDTVFVDYPAVPGK
jgi:hypothetical protein